MAAAHCSRFSGGVPESAAAGAGRDPETIESTAKGQAEGRALIAVLLKNKSPETASRETSVPVGRIYELRRNFYAAYWPM